MIARIRGSLEEKEEHRIVVDVSGVGYGLLVPSMVFHKLPDVGQEVTLQVYTNVREDAITLFGFLTHLERDVFEILLTANGVGPKLALTILSALEAMQVLEALAQGNRAMLNGISGIGKKTAERLLIELKEKCEKRLLLERGEPPVKKRGAPAMEHVAGWTSDLGSALVSLGYRENDVRQIVHEVLRRPDDARDFESGLKLALKLFGAGNSKSMRGTA